MKYRSDTEFPTGLGRWFGPQPEDRPTSNEQFRSGHPQAEFTRIHFADALETGRLLTGWTDQHVQFNRLVS